MNTVKSFPFRVLIIIFLSVFYFASGQVNVNPRAQWFVNDRFGMFIHWGVYSGAEGVWKGEKLRNNNNYAEWIQYRNRIDKVEYLTLLDNFNWDDIDPEKWVILAKKAGMKYVTITAKHHDGFALWDSKVSNYNIANYTNPKRDIIKELAAACKKHGLRLGLYYSHWVDWEHHYGWDHTKELSGISPENYDIYWQEKVIPQMRELLTGYGPVSIIWFDMWIHHSQTIVTREQLLQLKNLIRELQPECLVNSRLGLSLEEDNDVDFQELGDNVLGQTKKDFPWQSPATVADSWGYNRLDYEWKSTTSLLHSLISNVSLNGNFLLNIGPKANGDVPFEIEKRLLEMGEWLKTNGESVYGSGASDLPEEQHDWGIMTFKESSLLSSVYLNVFNWPFNRQLKVTGISAKPDLIYMLDDKHKTPLEFINDETVTRIKLPAFQSDSFVPVIVMEYSKKPSVTKGLVAASTDGGYSFTPKNTLFTSETLNTISPTRGGTIPMHVIITESTTLRWKIYVDDPGIKTFDISYSYQGKTDRNTLSINSSGLNLNHTVTATGKTVGEPRSNWIIDNFRSNRIGAVEFPLVGYYDIELVIKPAKDEEIKFQWLWLK